MADVTINIEQLINIMNLIAAIVIPLVLGALGFTITLVIKLTSLKKDVENIRRPIELIQEMALTQFLSGRHPSADTILKNLGDGN